MKRLFVLALLAGLLVGCKKEGEDKVEIYLLESFTRTVDASATPATIKITDARFSGSPLVADADIAGYSPAKHTFYLKKNVNPAIKNFGPDKAFAVTVNRQPVYYGEFRPLHLSSVVYGISFVEPYMTTREMKIDYLWLDNVPRIQNLDKRNDSRLVKALLKSGRLR
ncbi:MAG: hypothetical protein EOO14_20785 [Chitinophagaceae bacterium]|nr:MAG: hypothetical protein EOO14_20785 [Chitinophagaceae bacterium]